MKCQHSQMARRVRDTREAVVAGAAWALDLQSRENRPSAFQALAFQI